MKPRTTIRSSRTDNVAQAEAVRAEADPVVMAEEDLEAEVLAAEEVSAGRAVVAEGHLAAGRKGLASVIV